MEDERETKTSSSDVYFLIRASATTLDFPGLYNISKLNPCNLAAHQFVVLEFVFSVAIGYANNSFDLCRYETLDLLSTEAIS